MDGINVGFQINSADAQDGERDEVFVTVQLNGKTNELKVDTGAKCNVLSQKTFKQVSKGEEVTLQNTAANLVAYGGTRIEAMGLFMLSCCLKEHHHTVPFFMVDSDVQPLLGFRACVDMGIVRMSPDVHLVTMDSNADFRTQILRQYKRCFQ